MNHEQTLGELVDALNAAAGDDGVPRWRARPFAQQSTGQPPGVVNAGVILTMEPVYAIGPGLLPGSLDGLEVFTTGTDIRSVEVAGDVVRRVLGNLIRQTADDIDPDLPRPPRPAI